MGRAAPDPEVARLAGVLGQRFDELVDRLTERIAAEIDIYRSGRVVTRAELRRSVRDNFEFMLGQMSTSDEPDLSAPRHTGRLRAQQGAPLPEVLRAYRLGFAFLWEELLGRGPTHRAGAVAGAGRHRRDDLVPLRRVRRRAHRGVPGGRGRSAGEHRPAPVRAGRGADHRQRDRPRPGLGGGQAAGPALRGHLPGRGRGENTALGAEPLAGWRPGCSRTTSPRPGGCNRTTSSAWSPAADARWTPWSRCSASWPRPGSGSARPTPHWTRRRGRCGWPGSPCRTCRPGPPGSPSSTTARSARWWPPTRRWPGTWWRGCSAGCSPWTRRTAPRCWHDRGLAGRRRLGHRGRPGPVLPPEHRALPAAPGRGAHRPLDRRPARGGRAGRRPAGAARLPGPGRRRLTTTGRGQPSPRVSR